MFITDLHAISSQETFDNGLFRNQIRHFTGNKYEAIEPSYTGTIKPSMLRRMGKSIRMGIGAGIPLVEKHAVDGIIIGSSDGGLEDCIKFLNQIVQYDEGSLTPTNFVQSTPNALAGHLALMGTNTGYNITHVQKGLAFENCILDALMLFEEHKAGRLLIGNVEEISDYNFNIETLAGQFKETAVASECLLDSQTPGTVCGEGSAMFVVQSAANSYLAQIIDVAQITNPTESEITTMLQDLLSRNGRSASDIDAVVVGLNGDVRTDMQYHHVLDALFPQQGVFTFKNLVGEYPTASAFAVFLSAHILAGNDIPAELVLRRPACQPKHILIYNHYKGIQHGAILMSK